MRIGAANREYERWLGAQLKGDIVEADLEKKHKSMCEDPFVFLRATYWRWAETILEICPDLAGTPTVLAVGDIHLENFGTWTDKEGRLCWGVNDYDEAAEMPYILDLVRLATSAALAAAPSQISLKAICTNVLEGYAHGIEAPEAFVLDREHLWLRSRFVVDEAARAKFWQKIEKQYRDTLAEKHPERPPDRWLKLFAGALPDPSIKSPIGGAAREPAALAASAGSATASGTADRCCAKARRWCRPAGRARMAAARISSSTRSPSANIARPIPGTPRSGSLLMRRLSPNNRKISGEDLRDAARLLHPDLLWCMGRELAAIHLGARDQRDALRKDLETRKRRWFHTHVNRRRNSSAKNTRNGKNRLNSVPRYRLRKKGSP